MASQDQAGQASTDREVVDQARAARAADKLTSAIAILEEGARRLPQSSLIGRELGDALAEAGQRGPARAAFAKAAAADEHRSAMGSAVADMRAGRIADARQRLQAIQAVDPTHVYSQLALASIALQARDPRTALAELEPAVARYGCFDPVLQTLVRAHFEAGDYAQAAKAAQAWTRLAPDQAISWLSLADAQMAALHPDKALTSFQRGLELEPRHPRAQMGLGHAAKALGDAAGAIEAYQRAVRLDPGLGEAWWALADMKTYSFTSGELGTMSGQLPRIASRPYDHAALHYAIGKAAEDSGDLDAAFASYDQGAAIRARIEPFDADSFARTCEAVRQTLPDLAPAQAPAAGRPAPIFVIGLPRSGSTLVEQILASHSQVTASGELPFWPLYADELARGGDYARALANLTQTDYAALGERYRADSAPYQGEGAYFVDKTPNNFLHVGLIARALPDALFIDVRRDPRDWAWSAFRQNFGSGQAFTYDLRAMAAYYRHYAALTDHWRTACPQRIQLVRYEALIEDLEGQINAMLAGCGLEPEAACLKFHETRRAVNTPSAQQVRQPIYKSGVGQWRRVERHIQPFIEALGPAPL